MNINQLFQELKRRNVFRVAIAYAITGWLVIQITDTVFPRLGLPEWTVTFVIALALIGFPLSLIFAWAFELTPEGIRKSVEVDISQSVTAKTGKKLNGLIIGALSIALLFVVMERVFFARSTVFEGDSFQIDPASIAVLPFVNMSSDKENEYFSDGLSEELLNALAQVEDMRVAGRTSSFKFKGQNENIIEIGNELNVAHVLEGSVRKDGNRVRITAQLIKVKDGYHVWSETYDRELNDIFAIQEEISRKVLNELKVRLIPEDDSELESIPTQDVEAYQAFLKANQLVVNRDIDEINVAIELYNTAIRLDPGFAEAHGKLAFAYDLQDYYGNIPDEEAEALVLTHATKAMELNDQIGESHQAMGSYYFRIGDYEKAKEYYLKSLDLNPNLTDVYNLLGNVYLDELDEEEKWEEMVRKMYGLDPLNPIALYNMGRIGLRNEDLEAAEKYFRLNIKKNPEFIPSYLGLSLLKSYAPVSRFDESFMTLHKAFSLDNNFTRSLNLMVYRLFDMGMQKPAMHYFEILHDNFRESEEYHGLIHHIGYRTGNYSYFENDSRYFNNPKQDNIPNGFLHDMVDYSLHKNTPELTMDLFRFHKPALFDTNDPQVEEQDQGLRIALAQLYYHMGNTEAGDEQIDKYCAFVETIPDLEEEGKESDRYFFSTFNCLKNQQKFEEAAVYLDEIIHKRRTIGNAYNLQSSKRPIDIAFRNAPEIKPYVEEVLEELKGQAENVRLYLIEQGKWKEEWEVSE